MLNSEKLTQQEKSNNFRGTVIQFSLLQGSSTIRYLKPFSSKVFFFFSQFTNFLYILEISLVVCKVT